MPQHDLTPDAAGIALAALLRDALPLARFLNSGACAQEDRSAFRHMLGAEQVFEMSNVLNHLCSERARAQFRR